MTWAKRFKVAGSRLKEEGRLCEMTPRLVVIATSPTQPNPVKPGQGKSRWFEKTFKAIVQDSVASLK